MTGFFHYKNKYLKYFYFALANVVRCVLSLLGNEAQIKSATMNAKQLKSEIEKLAAEMNCTFVEACQAMQSAAATMKNEKMIMAIHKIKMASIKN